MPLCSGDLQLTIRQTERLHRLWRRYGREPLPPDLRPIISEAFDIDITADYGNLQLANPFIVASGEMSQHTSQIENARQAGWGALVLRSVAAEDSEGRCATSYLRAKPGTPGPPSRYSANDKRKERPVVVWNGKLDPRPLAAYLEFVHSAISVAGSLPLIASVAAGSDAEWKHTAAMLTRSGIKYLEFLQPTTQTFSFAMLNSTNHVLPKPPPCAVYSGLDALNHIINGAGTLQIYSFLAGKVKTPPKRSFNKFEQVLYKLMLDPDDGLIAGLIHLKTTRNIKSLRQAVGQADALRHSNPAANADQILE